MKTRNILILCTAFLVSMPCADAQVNWSEKQPNIFNLNNKSLVDEFLLLDDCFKNGYFKTLTPAHARYENVEGELYARANELNKLVELMAEARSEYGSESPQWVINGLHDKIASILEGDKYKTLIKSSISPFFTVKGLINDETKEYFQKHGGYENATKATMTKWDPKPVKQSISTSGTSQSGTIVSENASGATVDIGGMWEFLPIVDRYTGKTVYVKAEWYTPIRKQVFTSKKTVKTIEFKDYWDGTYMWLQ